MNPQEVRERRQGGLSGGLNRQVSQEERPRHMEMAVRHPGSYRGPFSWGSIGHRVPTILPQCLGLLTQPTPATLS